jgi:hypothetical protein
MQIDVQLYGSCQNKTYNIAWGNFKVVTTLSAWWGVLVTAVSAAWVIWLFIIRREAEPGAELDLNVEFVGRQDGKWLIEVVAKLTNRGAVRHWYRQFRVVVRYLLPGDEIIDGPEKVSYQLFCTRTIDDRVGRQSRYYANAAYIDPRLTFRHSYVTFVPEEATFVWVQLRLVFQRRDSWRPWKRVDEIKNSQRLFKVPPGGVPG